MMKLTLTVTQVETLRSLVTDALDSGEYYGPRAQYTKRIQALAGVLGNALEEYEFWGKKK